MRTLQNESPPLPLAVTPTVPLSRGCLRTAASFMEVRIQPQLPRLLQRTAKREETRAQEPGWKGAGLLGSEWDMGEVMLVISATDQGLPLTTAAVGY